MWAMYCVLTLGGGKVSTLGHEMSKERFHRFMGDVNRLIFELVHSSDCTEKLGGVVIIGIQYITCKVLTIEETWKKMMMMITATQTSSWI